MKYAYIKSKDGEAKFLTRTNDRTTISQRPFMFASAAEAFAVYDRWRTAMKMAGKDTGHFEIKEVEL